MGSDCSRLRRHAIELPPGLNKGLPNMKKVSGLKIQKIKVADLHLHPHNARQGDVGAITQSLEVHGQYRPIVVQKSTMNVIAGNHTLMAASALGWDEVEATILDVDDDQALRILLVDNRANDLATYDKTVLADLLESLARSDFGLEGSGFDGSDLDDMLAYNDFAFAPDLDDLLKEVGEMTDDDLMIRINFRVDPEVSQMWRDLLTQTNVADPDAAAAAIITREHVRVFHG